MDNRDFDIYFNHCGEDTMLVQYLSQYMRDRGFNTFDRSVDRVPVDGQEVISEAEALERSSMMIDVLTPDSVRDSSVQDMEARAVASSKPVVVICYEGVETPDNMRAFPTVRGERADIDGVMDHVYQIIHKYYSIG